MREMGQKRIINIGSLNCQGLKGKYELPELIEEISSHEIFGVNEIWLEKSEVKNIEVPGYKFYAKCRQKEKGPTKGRGDVKIKNWSNFLGALHGVAFRVINDKSKKNFELRPQERIPTPNTPGRAPGRSPVIFEILRFTINPIM